MSWTGQLTDNGTALLQQWVDQKILYITKAVAYDNSTEKATVKVSNYTFFSESSDQQGQGVKLELVFLPNTLAYTFNKIIVYAKLNSGEETDLAEYNNDISQEVPAEGDNPEFIFRLWCYLLLNKTDNIDVVVDSAAFVTTETLNTTLQNYATKDAPIIDSPEMTGTPLAPTASIGTDTNQIATTKFVNESIKANIDDALSDTSDHAVQNKVIKAAFDSISITVDTQMSDSSTNAVQNKIIKNYVDTTKTNLEQYVDNAIENQESPTLDNATLTNATATLTSESTAVTQDTIDNSTKIATTKFVKDVVGNLSITANLDENCNLTFSIGE